LIAAIIQINAASDVVVWRTPPPVPELWRKCSGSPIARTIQSVTTSSSSVLRGEHDQENPGLFTIPANMSPIIAGNEAMHGKYARNIGCYQVAVPFNIEVYIVFMVSSHGTGFSGGNSGSSFLR
jgi:hypothetical protein